MIKIAIAVYDTDQNKRTEYTERTFGSLIETTNHETTEIYFVDNASCEKTKKLLKSFDKFDCVTVITNKENEGTAEAINKVIKLREPKDFIIKLDNDVTFGRYGWADEMKEIIEADKEIGVLGLKRKDLPNSPTSEQYPTILEFLPHKLGDKWWVVEQCDDIIGTCIMMNPKLLDKIGYLYQPFQYGFDDVLLCARSLLKGFRNAFYPCVEIEHIDDGATPYTEWKKSVAGMFIHKIDEIKKEYVKNPSTIYYNPF